MTLGRQSETPHVPSWPALGDDADAVAVDADAVRGRQHVLSYIVSTFYANAIFFVTFAFAAYAWWARPDLYRSLRNALVLANLIAFTVFWLLPVAPPRMLAGFVDVVAKLGAIGAWHNSLIRYADQLAAMPSMHLGYAVWCSVVAWRVARTPAGRLTAVCFGVAYPVVTVLAVMATGNHYLLDVLAGMATTLVAIAIVELGVPALVGLWRRGG